MNIPDTPYYRAMLVPSDAGFHVDVMAHLSGGPGAFVISTPEFFLLAREVDLTAPMEELMNPWCRFPHDQCNALCIGLCAGDAALAYMALVAVAGEREFIGWQTRRGTIVVRKTGPSFRKYVETIRGRTRLRH